MINAVRIVGDGIFFEKFLSDFLPVRKEASEKSRLYSNSATARYCTVYKLSVCSSIVTQFRVRDEW